MQLTCKKYTTEKPNPLGSNQNKPNIKTNIMSHYWSQYKK